MKTFNFKKVIASFVVLTVFASFAGDIRWEKAKNITGDADVRTDGILKYAYANKAVVVNGVAFSAGITKTYIPNADQLLSNIDLQNCNAIYIDSNFYAKEVPEGASDEYLQILRAGVYNQADVGVVSQSGITLRNLIPGRSYIVQLWTHDRRENPGSYRSIVLDGKETALLRTSTGFGQHITGQFTATDKTQSFSIFGYSTKQGEAPVTQINSIQVRDVTPMITKWGDAKNIVSEADVCTDGELIFAAHCSDQGTVIVNGVPFLPQSSKVNWLGAQVTLDGLIYHNGDSFGNINPDGDMTSEYKKILRGAIYRADDVGVININRLTPGARYLVQLWVNDSRTSSSPKSRTIRVDNHTVLWYQQPSSSYGQYVIGIFTADSTTKRIVIDRVGTTDIQFNAIQVRRLDSGLETHWRVTPITTSDDDVRIDGTSFYAYNFAAAITDAEINGVVFKGCKRSGLNYSNDDISLVFPTEGSNHNSAFFGDSKDNTSEGYKIMLKSSTYTTGGSSDDTPSKLILKRLVPGRRYLVQLWASDSRSGGSHVSVAMTRQMDVDGAVRMRFHNAGVISYPRGDIATGIFTATETTKSIILLSHNPGDESKRAVQLNGLQVRDLGEANGTPFNVWTGGANGIWSMDATNWADLAGNAREGDIWSIEKGATNTALFALDVNVLPSDALRVDGIAGAGALTVGEDDDSKSVLANFVESPNCTFKSVWESDKLAKYDVGVFTLEGLSPNLSTVIVGGGSLTLSRTDALNLSSDVVVETNATLTLAVGSSPILRRLAGSGTLVFDGTIDLTNDSTQSFTGTIDGDVTIRKKGLGDWVFGGTQSGEFFLDVEEGNVILASDNINVSIAKDATINLNGKTRSIGSVSGKGIISNGKISGELSVQDGSKISLSDVSLSDIVINGTSSVVFTGDVDLTGVTIRVENPSSVAPAGIAVLSSNGAITGKPTFEFGERGYEARLSDDGYKVHYLGFTIILR